MAKVKVRASTKINNIGANVPVNGKPVPKRENIGANVEVKSK